MTAPPLQSLPARATWVVAAAAGVLALVLLITVERYGYHRDELYFLTLRPAWGYVDQPPFLPWLARTVDTLSLGLPALRLPSAVFAVSSVFVVAAITREVGGGRFAQGISAWGYALGGFTLLFGHLMLTASVDLLLWPVILLCVLRALLREQARWWWLAGVVVGLSTYNKWLVIYLVAAVVAGLLLVGPRRVLASRAVVGAAALALLLAVPNIVWQVRHGLPQLDMGRALAAENAADVRAQVLPVLLVMIGPLTVPVWVAGLVALIRRRDWRPIRFLAPALGVVVLLTALGGSQVYYPYGVLSAVFAVGCVPVADLTQRRPRWRPAVLSVLVLHLVTGVAISGSVLPLSVLGRTFVPDTNPTVGDMVGWPRYVEQVDAVVRDARRTDADVVVLTSNFGEAGALRRFSRLRDVPVVSGFNALWDEGGPPPSTRTVVVVGGRLRAVEPLFASCHVRDRLHHDLPVDNEEEGQPVAVCTDPNRPWSELWPTLRHLG